jgi:outer membrane biosynthesis protein TonB
MKTIVLIISLLLMACYAPAKTAPVFSWYAESKIQQPKPPPRPPKVKEPGKPKPPKAKAPRKPIAPKPVKPTKAPPKPPIIK